MSDISLVLYQVKELESTVQNLQTQVYELQHQLDLREDEGRERDRTLREQGHAIRNMTMVLERVVNVVIPKVLENEPE